MSQEDFDMNSPWDDDTPVVHVEESNDKIEEDADWGNFHGSRLVPERPPAVPSLRDFDPLVPWSFLRLEISLKSGSTIVASNFKRVHLKSNYTKSR